jgi:hypothetical protein
MPPLTSVKAEWSPPMESKICEMGCGRSFMRRIPISAKHGPKVCKSCISLSIEQRERQFEEQHARETKARLGIF